MSTTATPPAAPKESNRAVIALVLGIVSLVCCQLVAPVAWYMGAAERTAIRQGRAPEKNHTIATVAMVLGIVGTILLVCGIIFMAFFGGLAMLAGAIRH